MKSFPKIPETMLAVRLHGAGFENMRVERVPVPVPGDNQLLARVDAAGVCTSNLKLLAQGSNHPLVNGWDLGRYPIQLGDEGCVTIVAAGRNLQDHFPVGRRYVIQPAVDVAPINHRERYRNHAAGVVKVAVGYTLPGHLAQYTLVGEEILAGKCLLPLPDETMPAFAATLAEPLSCVISSHDRHVHIAQSAPDAPRVPRLGLLSGGISMVVGAGPMGRMHAEAALRAKPRHLLVTDISPQRLAWVTENLAARAQAVGATLHAVLADRGPELLREISQDLGADDVIVAVGSPAVQTEAQAWLARGGVLNLFAGLKQGEHLLPLNSVRVHYDDIRLVGSSGGAPVDVAEALRLLASGKIDAGRHVALAGSLEEFPRALEMVRQTATDGKIVLYPHIRPTPLEPTHRWTGADEQKFVQNHA